MGKGSRNRQLHLQDREENPKKYKKKVQKQMPKWIKTAICVVLLVGVLFGIGAGILTVLIRVWGVYPEGVSFGILLMNILNPFIEKLTRRRVFGLGGKKA